MAYIEIELIHKDIDDYFYTEWDIETDEDYTAEEYINMITSYSVSDMSALTVFNSEGQDILLDLGLELEEFEEFKNIVLKILKDERIDFLVREEYWNKVMNWIERTYPSEEYK